jgi:hypothetical protein
MAERFKIRNRAHEPSGAAKRLAGFTTHPELGGRVLAPRATRFVLVSELTARLLDDVEKYQACGVVSFQAEFGRPVEVDVPTLRTRLDLAAALALPETTQESAPRYPGISAEVLLVDEIAFAEEGTGAPSADPVAPTEPAPAAVEKEKTEKKEKKDKEEGKKGAEPEEKSPEEAPPETPEEGTATLADSFLEDVPRDVEEPAVKVFTEEELSALTGAKLDEILVGTFKHDPKQLYKIGNKAKKVEHILALQAGTATE